MLPKIYTPGPGKEDIYQDNYPYWYLGVSLIAHLFTIKYASLQAGTVYCLYRLCYVDAGYNKPGPSAGVKKS